MTQPAQAQERSPLQVFIDGILAEVNRRWNENVPPEEQDRINSAAIPFIESVVWVPNGQSPFSSPHGAPLPMRVGEAMPNNAAAGAVAIFQDDVEVRVYTLPSRDMTDADRKAGLFIGPRLYTFSKTFTTYTSSIMTLSVMQEMLVREYLGVVEDVFGDEDDEPAAPAADAEEEEEDDDDKPAAASPAAQQSGQAGS